MTTRPLGHARLWHQPAEFPDPRPPVLLVHGGYHGAWCWAAWIERLVADGREVAALDLRGHGGLPQPPGYPESGVMAFVDDVVAAIGTFERQPVVVGHSLGCLLVPLAASRRPTAGLLLLCPSPPGNLPGAAKVRLVPEGQPVPPLSMEVARTLYAPHLSDAEAAALAAKLCAESPRLLNERYDLRVPVDAAALQVPVLVVEGGRDDPERHPPGQDQAIAAFYGGRHLRIDAAPHNLMMGPGSTDWFDTIWTRFNGLTGGG